MIDLSELNIVDYILYGCLAVALVYEMYFLLRYLAGALYQRQPRLSHTKEGVSVIVCARNEAANLEQYLQSLLSQDYPTYEVIVVNDGSEDGTREVLENYQHQDPRLRITFVPRDTHMRSTKKLGLTLAAKAAKYDYLLLTDADCRPESKDWIHAMMTGFSAPEIEIVLGFGAYFPLHTGLNRLIRFDTLFNGLHYLGAAATHRPYMGVGRNLAYRKQTFFESGGFTRMMTERAGDDDLFVNHVANRHNTAVVTLPESLTWSLPKTSMHAWLQQKRRHLGVSPKYTPGSKFHLGLEPVMRGLFYAMIIAVAVMGGPLGWIVAATAYMLRMVTMLIILNVGAKRMKVHHVGMEAIPLDIVLPVLSLVIMLIRPFYKDTLRW